MGGAPDARSATRMAVAARRPSGRSLAAVAERYGDRRLAWLTFVAVLAVAVAVQRHGLYVYDARVMLGVTQNLVDHGSLRSTYDPLHLNSPYASYGIGMSLAFLPGVLIAKALGIAASSVVSLTNGVIVAATGVALLKVARAAKLSRATGLIAALVYGLLSMAIGYLAGGFSEPGVGLAGVLAVLGVLRWRGGEWSGPWIAGGVWLWLSCSEPMACCWSPCPF